MILKVIKEARKEYGRLTQEIAERQQQRKLLEGLIAVYPSTQALNKMVVECIRSHGGHASFAVIVSHLRNEGVIDMKQPKISVALHANKAIKFNKDKGEWGLV